MEINKCKKKFKLLFDKLLFQENFELSSYYSENLIKCLDGTEDECAGKLLDTPFFSDLILYSLTNLDKVTTSVKTFIFKVFTIALKNELQFSKLGLLQGFKLVMEKFFILQMDNPPVALHLAGLRGATAHTEHYSGIVRLIHLKGWSLILRPDTHHRASKVAEATYNFMAKLIWKLDEYDEEQALIEVLAHITEPIMTSEYVNVQVIDIEDEKALYEPILTYVHTLVAIVRDYEKKPGQNKVIQLLYRRFIIEGPLYMILQLTRNAELANLICEFQFNFMLAMFKEYLSSGIQGNRDIPTEIINIYYNVVLCLLSKRMTSVLLFFVVKCITIIAKMEANPFPETFERHGRTFNLRNQFITLIIVPMLSYTLYADLPGKNNAILKEAIEGYTLKLIKLNSEYVVKAAYSFRSLMESCDAKNIVIQTLKEVFKLKGHLNVAQAGMLYQALFYTLKQHVISDGSGALILNDNLLKTPDDVKLLSLVLEAIKMLLKEHNINWYENVEIISLQTTLMDLLKQDCLPTKQLLQVLDLIDLSINKFLSPDMALLMESKRGSTLNEISAIMKSYIQHEEWEVRDSSLHMLLSCTEVAFVKYLPLRKLLSENNLIVLAVHPALTDPEFYVQATALKCLAAATKIESIWRDVLVDYPNLHNKLIYILGHHTEGIVRKEAANVLTEVYINNKVKEEFARSLYDAMIVAAIKDLHWEVQLAALNFWRHAIQNIMSNRGMIDGKFPSVTFSKEKRKIITLNEKEIIKQLIGIMNELSSIGCLTVLHKCLDEEINLDVMELAYSVATDLMTIIDYYNFEGVPGESIISNEYSPQLNYNDNTPVQYVGQCIDEAMDLCNESIRYQTALRDNITEGILNTTDYDLLIHCYENSFRIKRDDIEEVVVTPPIVNSINPNRFLKSFKETDYLSKIENKKNWTLGPRSLDLLLDEILALGEMRRDIIDECN